MVGSEDGKRISRAKKDWVRDGRRLAPLCYFVCVCP